MAVIGNLRIKSKIWYNNKGKLKKFLKFLKFIKFEDIETRMFNFFVILELNDRISILQQCQTL
jgi:hypothetical protein